MLSFVLLSTRSFFFFFFNDTATTEIYTLSLHDALPISSDGSHLQDVHRREAGAPRRALSPRDRGAGRAAARRGGRGEPQGRSERGGGGARGGGLGAHDRAHPRADPLLHRGEPRHPHGRVRPAPRRDDGP